MRSTLESRYLRRYVVVTGGGMEAEEMLGAWLADGLAVESRLTANGWVHKVAEVDR